MKTLKLFAFTALIMLLTTTVFAQKTVVRLGLGGLAVGNLNFDAEYALNDNQSLSLNLGVLLPRKVPQSLLEGSESTIFGEPKLKGISIAPEYRFYNRSKKALNGSYIAPYVKYSSYNTDISGIYDGAEGIINGRLSTLGVGIQFGKQWLINDRISIDWSFFGIGLNNNTLSLRLESDDPGVNFNELEDNLASELTDAPGFISNRIQTEFGEDYAALKAPFFFPALRSSLSIGIAF